MALPHQSIATINSPEFINLQPLDIFSMDAVYAYGIKLLLVQRMKMFNREKGTDSYHKIYDTILGETI